MGNPVGAASSARNPKPIPTANPVPFAAFSVQTTTLYWPIITTHPQAVVVSCELVTGQAPGAPGRRFLAARSDGRRYHVGVDLFAYAGDDVVACADGRIVAFYRFYTRANGEETYALLIEHAGFVANYGEVTASSATVFGWKVGDTVRAGQPIGRVSGTSMIHFETYVTGTKASARWMRNGPRPAALQNPTKVLLDLAARGLRLKVGGSAAPQPMITAPLDAGAPAPAFVSWHSFDGGQEWRYDRRGVYLRSAPNTPLRTPGEPVTCRRIYELYGPAILTSAARHGVNPALIVMTIATETHFARGDGFTGPRTFRWEARVNNTDVSPSFLGAYSAGPMQCLSTTLREMLVNHGAAWGLAYHPLTVAPALNPRPVPSPAAHPLYDGPSNIDLGTAEIRMRWKKTGEDPIFVAAAFNSGGLYTSSKNAWRLRSQGDHLDRASRWYGDACEVLSAEGAF